MGLSFLNSEQVDTITNMVIDEFSEGNLTKPDVTEYVLLLCEDIPGLVEEQQQELADEVWRIVSEN